MPPHPNRPLGQAQELVLADQLLSLVGSQDPGTLRYLAGFLAGIAAERDRASGTLTPSSMPATPAESAGVSRATVLYASQTGNGRRIGEKLQRQLESQGLAARLVNVADFRSKELANERLLYLIVSTHGDGDPPDDARTFYDFVTGRKAPRLEQLRFAVLALGDSSYPQYCSTGRTLDARLAELGATRLAARLDCDVDYQSAADGWSSQAVQLAREHLQSPHIAIVSAPPPTRSQIAERDRPVEVDVLAVQSIAARSSDHPVTHLELAAPADTLPYEPGDAIGIWHANPSWVVDQFVERLHLDAAAKVSIDGREASVHEWLAEHRDLTRLARPFLDAHAERAGSPALDGLRQGNDVEALRRLLRDWQPLDLLEEFPAPWDAESLIRALRPLTPRLYSIASSRAAVGDEAHITVAAVDYQHNGQRRVGAASHFLTQLGNAASQRVRAYIEPNPRFRLPADSARDVIMIGPGTGVAPFRGFLQQRIESGAQGRNWLFFGGRHLQTDFLYQVEWLEARRNGTLHRLEVAFSRDQSHKVYVQDRIRACGAELSHWIESGASLYVCGDAQRMAPDVHAALIEVLEQHTGRSNEAAQEYLSDLAAQRRYARDVY